MLYCSQVIPRESDGGAYHARSLGIRQLGVLALIGINLKNVHGEVDKSTLPRIVLVILTTGMPGMSISQ
jgi:hypothetical protein